MQKWPYLRNNVEFRDGFWIRYESQASSSAVNHIFHFSIGRVGQIAQNGEDGHCCQDAGKRISQTDDSRISVFGQARREKKIDRRRYWTATCTEIEDSYL